MGIHGLSFFIKSNPNLSRNEQWKQSDQIVDQFIIDGNAFVYHLAFEHKAYWTHGGQYAHISNIVSQKINALQQTGIQPTFLFDGALPEGKEETRLRRYKNYLEKEETTCWSLKQINDSNQGTQIDLNNNHYYGELFLIPPLTLEVCIQTIKQHPGVEVIHCQHEADGEVVLLAEKRNAYLVSQDSDMHVCPHIGKGYIPLDLLKIPSPEDEDAIVSASVFHPEELASLLRLDVDMLPLFGTLLGNDYLESGLIRGPIKSWAMLAGIQSPKHQSTQWPKMVAELILHCQIKGEENEDKSAIIKNVVEQLKPIISQTSTRVKEEKLIDLEEKIVHSIYRYDPHNPLIPPQQHLDEQSIQDNIGKMTCQVSQGLSRHIMDVMASKSFWCALFLEDMERECCWDVSRSLRQDLYGLIALRLGRNEIKVKEYVREKHHLKSELQLGGTESVSLSSNVSKRDYFLRAHVTSWESLAHFQDQPVVQPLILCLRYLIYYGALQNGGRLFNHEVIAFILANLGSLAPALGFKKDSIPEVRGVPALTKRSLHLTAQYQTILYSSYLLAQILDFPIYRDNRLTFMYDGLLFHYYIELTLGGASMAKLMSGLPEPFSLLFHQVYISVMDGLDNKIRLVYDYNIPLSGDWEITDSKPKRLNVEKKGTKSKKKKSEIRHPMNGNAFDVLSFGCNFDDE
ncbi:PIN domain-like protein [Backusella circina FSU 941]|nr:PIN domain-like protein [Backusella circina FSU 941]